MPYCPNCGHENSAEARFCANCGRPMTDVAPPAQTPPPGSDVPSGQAPSSEPLMGQPVPGPYSSEALVIPQRARNIAMFCHVAAFAGFIGIPFGNIIGPLIVWLLFKEEHPFIDENGKSSLNFQISIAIYVVISIILAFIIIGFFLLFALWIFGLIAVIIGAIRAANGEEHRYPLSFHFIS
ncbi:MAG: DUF4870 domain-containing protein [Chloroflexi bacterium]|nr:DUF4870 domain-containing protein [Chloroflexota bacterium]